VSRTVSVLRWCCFNLKRAGLVPVSASGPSRGARVVPVPTLPAWVQMRFVVGVSVANTSFRPLQSRFSPVSNHSVVTVSINTTLATSLLPRYGITGRTLTEQGLKR
jgi:hypothetical protein